MYWTGHRSLILNRIIRRMTNRAETLACPNIFTVLHINTASSTFFHFDSTCQVLSTYGLSQTMTFANNIRKYFKGE